MMVQSCPANIKFFLYIRNTCSVITFIKEYHECFLQNCLSCFLHNKTECSFDKCKNFFNKNILIERFFLGIGIIARIRVFAIDHFQWETIICPKDTCITSTDKYYFFRLSSRRMNESISSRKRAASIKSRALAAVSIDFLDCCIAFSRASTDMNCTTGSAAISAFSGSV